MCYMAQKQIFWIFSNVQFIIHKVCHKYFPSTLPIFRKDWVTTFGSEAVYKDLNCQMEEKHLFLQDAK